MNYIDQNDKKFLEDLTRRKEFYQYFMEDTEEPKIHKKFTLDDFSQTYLEPQSYQNLIVEFLKPETKYRRLLLEWDPGMGKTIASCLIANEFIKLYEKQNILDEEEIGSVFILGFTEEIFKRDLISYPIFGYINDEELKKLKELRILARDENQLDIDNLQDFINNIKKRLSDRSSRGFYKFYGYKAFVNRIFMLNDFKKNINDLSEEEIKKSLQDGSLKWNKPLLNSFKNSLLICDEIHNVYNSLEKNNWGVAIQLVLDQEPSLKVLFLSATPINNSPSEVVDLANLLLPPNQKVAKVDFFNQRELKPGALEKIYNIFSGKVSFVQDSNVKYLAPYNIVGEKIPSIDYLKFIRCKMSPYHYKTYKHEYDGVLAQDEQYLMDIVFPNPDSPYGIYKTADVKKVLSFENLDFKMTNDIITGPGLQKEKIKEYSMKYYNLLDDLDNNLMDQYSGKILIYHDVVHISGVLLIEQLLQHNGYCHIDQHETPNTKCALCGVIKSKHLKFGGGWTFNKNFPKVLEKWPNAYLCPMKSIVLSYNDDVKGYATFEESTNEIFVIEANLSNWDDLPILLDYLSIKVITWRSTDEKITNKLIDNWFNVYDQIDDETYLAREFIPGEVELDLENQNMEKIHPFYEVKLLVPGMEQWEKFNIVTSDTVILLMKDNEIHGYVILDESNLQDYWFQDKSITLRAMQYMFGKYYQQVFYRNKLIWQNTKMGGKVAKHEYKPAKYIIAHNEIDKATLYKNIDKMNSADNLYGDKCKILIGSKLIRESYNFVAMRKLKVMSKPANITTLLQIFGRVRRKKAHILLPKEHQNIEIKIFTICLPDGGLSHEEIKYREKIQDYKVIQLINRKRHEGAIDGVVSRNIILPNLKKNDLGALYFEPHQPIKKYNLKDLNLGTFDVFSSDKEISTITYVIKRLYVEVSVCFTIDDLWKLVQNPPFTIYQNMKFIQRDYFIIALNSLIFSSETIFNKKDMITLLLDNVDKRIMLDNGNIGYIHHINKYYIFVPFREASDFSFDAPFRSWNVSNIKSINLSKYIKDSIIAFNYEKTLKNFIYAFKDTPIEQLSNISSFGVNFHNKFIEDIIKYIFDILTDPKIKDKDPNHDFYFKMLYYYDVMNLIIFASNAKDFILQNYVGFLSESASRSSIQSSEEKIKHSSAIYNSALDRAKNIINAKRNKKPIKVNSDDLPVGHFMTGNPRFYHPDKGWFDSPEYVQLANEFKENDTIIGYYEKGNSFKVKFKIRNPIHKIQKHKDIRMIEKGSICSSISKDSLIELANKLSLKVPPSNIQTLCREIENELQRRELEERKKKSNIKWFYSFWESRPNEKKNITFSTS